jgi:hypothetical protein
MLIDQSAIIRYLYSEDDFDERPRITPEGDLPRLKWPGPEGIHRVENTDTIEYLALRVELKNG